jgi:transposase
MKPWETVTMSRKEARRPGWVQLAVAGKITTAEGARGLEMSLRQFRRLKARYRAEGVRGLVHRRRGQPSGRGLDVELRDRIVELAQTTYRDFNDCHATEKLRALEGLPVSRSTVRRLRRARGMPPKRRRRPPQHRARRPRHPTMGSLVLVDGSKFDWLGTWTRHVAGWISTDDASPQAPRRPSRPREPDQGAAAPDSGGAGPGLGPDGGHLHVHEEPPHRDHKRPLLYQFMRPWCDGSTALLVDPLELLERLAALVPPPRLPLLAYHGLLAPRGAATLCSLLSNQRPGISSVWGWRPSRRRAGARRLTRARSRPPPGVAVPVCART